VRANAFARRLRAGDPDALDDLNIALQFAGGSIGDAAILVGLAGASSLWRIAYAAPAVRAVVAEHGRRRGRVRKEIVR
jgi:hypothetical protein